MIKFMLDIFRTLLRIHRDLKTLERRVGYLEATVADERDVLDLRARVQEFDVG